MSDALPLLEEVISYKVLLLDEKPHQENLQTTLSQYGIGLHLSHEVAGLKRLRKDPGAYNLAVIGKHTNRKKCEAYILEHLKGVNYILALTASDALLVQQIRAARTKLQSSRIDVSSPIYGLSGQEMMLQLEVYKECLVEVEQFYKTFFNPNKHKMLFGGRLTLGTTNIPILKVDKSYVSVTIDFKDVFLVPIDIARSDSR